MNWRLQQALWLPKLVAKAGLWILVVVAYFVLFWATLIVALMRTLLDALERKD